MKAKLVQILFKLFSKFSLATAHKLAVFLGTIAFFLPVRERKISEINIAKIFADKSSNFRKNLLKQSLRETAKSILESVPIWQLTATQIQQLVIVHGEQQINSQQGIIFVVPHFASWEIVNLWLSINYPLTSLYRTAKIHEMDKTILDVRQKFGTKMVADNLKGVMVLKKALDNKHKVLIAPDQDPGESGSVVVNFFGIPARTSTLVPKLAKKTNAKILLIYTIRQQQKFTLHIVAAPPLVYEDNIKVAAQTLNDELEKIILLAPEQYAWSYKRFKYQSDNSQIY